MGSLKPPERLHDDNNVESLQYIQSVSLTEDFAYPQEFYDRVIQLWSDPGVQRAFNRMGEFPLIDSTKYFLDKIQVIRKDDYSPSDKKKNF
nr:guanine nucleotide-binding protein G(s) subunit alpha-like isoform X2 [Parasteatoda tepidariorum]